MSHDAARLKPKEVNKLGLLSAKRHVLFCGGPDCCSRREGEHMWDFIKQQVKLHNIPAQRTLVKCIRICHSGPWIIVYPEGTWYGNLTTEKVARILDQHVTKGEPIQEWVSIVNPLESSISPSSEPSN